MGTIVGAGVFGAGLCGARSSRYGCGVCGDQTGCRRGASNTWFNAERMWVRRERMVVGNVKSQ